MKARVATGPFEPVIGLEIHVRLDTRTKLFCRCIADSDGPPNTRICPVCLGLPGTDLALNAAAVEQAVRAALVFGCTIHEVSRFARKHYIYPDLPRGYQITQADQPLATGGAVVYEREARAVRVPLQRIHLEEDTARTSYASNGALQLDHNRAGLPLIEIVTEPVLGSPREAREVLDHLKRTLQYALVSECSMEAGHLRVDANVSLRGGSVAGERTELKNLNSFAGVERALEHEIERQRALLREGRSPERETRRWDASRGVSVLLRGSDAREHRMMDDPELRPLRVPGELVDRLRASIPELPAARARRLQIEFGVSRAHAEMLTTRREIVELFEALLSHGAPRDLATSWVLGEVLQFAGEHPDRPLPEPGALGLLLEMIVDERITRAQAQRVYGAMASTGAPPQEIVARLALPAAPDADRLDEWIQEALGAYPEEAKRYRAGERRLFDFFMGRVMARSRGAARPAELAGRLRTALEPQA